MEYLLENILNMVGFLVGLCIGLASYLGYRNTGSPVLFRMSVAFLSIGAGFFVIWIGYLAEDLVLNQGNIDRSVQALGIAIQTVGYFFIAFSHGVKSFFPKNRAFRSIAPLPLLISGTHIEHVLRSVSFILLTYGAIETILSYSNVSTWRIYRVVFNIYNISILIKISLAVHTSGSGAMERNARFFGKNDFTPCENAIKKYPTVWIAIPSACTDLSMFP